MQANEGDWNAQEFVKTSEYANLQAALGSSGKTLYQLEADIVDQIE